MLAKMLERPAALSSELMMIAQISKTPIKTTGKWLVILLAFAGTISAVDHRAPAMRKWSINLKDKFEFQPFDRPITFRWTLHQDVEFLPPDKIIVYQVNRARGPVTLRPRDASGGGGNFILEIR